MKVDFSKMQMKDIEGKIVNSPELYKTVANVLWRGAKTLDLVDVAMAINRGEVVELRDDEVEEIKELVKDLKSGVFAFARKQILDFIESVQEAEK